MLNLLRCLSAVALLVTLFSVQAKECPNGTSCEFYMNEHGDLLTVKPENHAPTVLFSGDGQQSKTFGEYVIKRSDAYYLVHESYGNDKSFVIVPIESDGHKIGYDRVLYFYLSLQNSAQSGRDVWAGSEIVLPQRSPIGGFSWDNIYKLQSSIKQSRDEFNTLHTQSGFSAISVAIHNITGESTGTRLYVYPEALGATPESIVCFTRCVRSSLHPTGVFRGGVGKHPITLSIEERHGKITGSYSYDGKAGSLSLDGIVEGDQILLREHPTSAPLKTTGTFTATRRDNSYRGTWTSEANRTQLPFFAIIDCI